MKPIQEREDFGEALEDEVVAKSYWPNAKGRLVDFWRGSGTWETYNVATFCCGLAPVMQC